VKVTVITYADDNAMKYFKYTYPLFKHWCNNKNYKLKVFCNNPAKCYTTWMKIYYLIEVMKQNDSDVLCFFDADIIINNLNLDLTQFINEKYDVYISKNGWNGGDLMNSGSILLKCNNRSLQFLEEVWSYHEGEYSFKLFWEQTVINKLYEEKYSNIIFPLEMRDLNSYGDDNYIHNPNNNVYHIMAKPIEVKIKLAKEHLLNLKNKNIYISGMENLI